MHFYLQTCKQLASSDCVPFVHKQLFTQQRVFVELFPCKTSQRKKTLKTFSDYFSSVWMETMAAALITHAALPPSSLKLYSRLFPRFGFKSGDNPIKQTSLDFKKNKFLKILWIFTTHDTLFLCKLKSRSKKQLWLLILFIG